MAERTLLLRNADVVVTMNAADEEIRDGGVLISGNRIAAVGHTPDLPREADEILELSGHVLLPGLVNTHHHMYQSLTRVVPCAQDSALFGWLTELLPLWAGLTPEMIRVSTLTAMAELILSGCTTSSDHLYVYPDGCRLDDSLAAAEDIGMRFHACRGSMTRGRSQGGLPPDALVESEDAVLRETQRLIESYHDPARYAMRRVAVAPCSPYTVSLDMMRESARLARSYGVSLHTHLAENDDDVTYGRESYGTYGMTPAELAENLGWVGPDVWHAHCVKLDPSGIAAFARSGTGVAHCPSSNMRLASGIAPVHAMRAAGVPVGLGVDGSASADAGNMIGEARQAMLLQRVGFGPQAMTARQALALATRDGARVLGRDDIGQLAPDMAADVVAFDLSGVGLAGAGHDPVAGLVFCDPGRVSLSVIDGRVVVRDGRLLTLDLRPVLERHNALARELVNARSAHQAQHAR